MSGDKVQVPGLQGHESFGHFCASSTDLAAVTGLSSPAVEPIGGCNKVLCSMEIGAYTSTSSEKRGSAFRPNFSLILVI
jgi:hypothetical protein